MKPETESSVSKAKTEKKARVEVLRGPTIKTKAATREAKSRSRKPEVSIVETRNAVTPSTSIKARKNVSDLEFLDTVKETVYRKLLDNELDLKIDSGFKAIELKNKISETSENERLLLEILSEIRSEELSRS